MRDDPQEGALATAPPELPFETLRRDHNARRCGIAVWLVVLALGVVGALGVTDRTASSRAENIELEVRYSRVARTGLTAPLSIVVRSADGFASPPRLRIDREYLAIFSTFDLEPQPSRSWSDGERVMWEFEPPPASTLAIDVAARVDPSAQTGATGEIAVLDGDRPRAQVALATTILP